MPGFVVLAIYGIDRSEKSMAALTGSWKIARAASKLVYLSSSSQFWACLLAGIDLTLAGPPGDETVSNLKLLLAVCSANE
jgi:hypothetical protein